MVFCLFPFYLSTSLTFLILLTSINIPHLLGVSCQLFYPISNLTCFKAIVFCPETSSFVWSLKFQCCAGSGFPFPMVLLYVADNLRFHSISSHALPSPLSFLSPPLAFLHVGSEDGELGLLQLHHILPLEIPFSLTTRGLFLPSPSQKEI